MPVEMTAQQAQIWLGEAADMLAGLTDAILAAGRLVENFPELSPPQAMLNSLTSSWESLHKTFNDVYSAAYGSPATVNEPTSRPGAEARVGEA